jgi:hypothetical protein
MADPTPVSAPIPTDPSLSSLPTPAPIPNGTTAASADVEMVDSQPIKTEVGVPNYELAERRLTCTANTATRSANTRRRAHTYIAQFTTSRQRSTTGAYTCEPARESHEGVLESECHAAFAGGDETPCDS